MLLVQALGENSTVLVEILTSPELYSTTIRFDGAFTSVRMLHGPNRCSAACSALVVRWLVTEPVVDVALIVELGELVVSLAVSTRVSARLTKTTAIRA